MRCPDCNRFVSFSDDIEAEIMNVDYDHGACTVDVDLELCRTCAECGEQLMRAEMSLHAKVPAETMEAIRERMKGVRPSGDEEEIDLDADLQEDVEVSLVSKGIWNVRVVVDIVVNGDMPNPISIELNERVEASDFEEV